ncbi:MAG: NAD(P)/FAD-dependent oxidoreductase [Rhodospirillales bacterium]
MADSAKIHDTDVAIIGAGPVGLFAVFECGMLDMRSRVIDALDAAGGQCTALYPEKPIYDVPGYPLIGAAELVERLMAQAAPFKPGFHLGQQVMALDRTADGFALATDKGERIAARAVLICAGVGAFGPNRPPLPGIETYEGGAVRYLVTRREDFRGKRVAIAGGGDSAVDWALSLAEVAAKVMVVHRRDRFRAAPDSARRLKALAELGKIELVIPYQLDALEGDGQRLSAVIVKSLDGKSRRLEADFLLPFFGLAMTLGPIARWGLNLERNHIAVDPATAETSTPGIYAAGDIAAYKGKLKLILTGFAEAAQAAHAMYPRVHPGKALHFEYSTSKGVPAA